MKMREIIDLVEAFEAHPDPRENPAFEQWFGDSKVVDAEGRPLPVFHGTKHEIKVFGKHDDIPYRGGIIAFFSTSHEFANNYATGGSSNTNGANVASPSLKW